MLQTFGAFCFGIVIGWITYRTLRRTKTNGLSDIATIIGAVGGAAVISLFPSQSDSFGAYCIGLAIGFFAYLLVAGVIDFFSARTPALKPVSKWLGNEHLEPDEPQPDEPKPDEPDRDSVPPPSE